MISNIRNDGGGGSSSTTSGSSFSVTSIDRDPVFGSGSGGKTGSESLAEGGAPESTVTIDPQTTSVSEKYAGDPKAAVSDMVDLAHDADDGETATFDSTPANEEGKAAIQDSVRSIVEATSDSTPDLPENTPGMNLPTQVPDVPTDIPEFDLPTGQAKMVILGFAALVLALIFGG